MLTTPSRLLIVLSLVVPLAAAPTLSLAQGAASGGSAGATNTSKAQVKAQRKAARKQSRAQRNAELKKLEDNGYNPGQSNDANYPQGLQNAEKKAAGQQPASQ